ncbi:hypothetical protein K438DRAFT_1848706 [Mycena galopus ATCC 62051]|nr:hypothetical protein K438DRAFT_1848706 [Mycena galopus ATCC 62051]
MVHQCAHVLALALVLSDEVGEAAHAPLYLLITARANARRGRGGRGDMTTRRGKPRQHKGNGTMHREGPYTEMNRRSGAPTLKRNQRLGHGIPISAPGCTARPTSPWRYCKTPHDTTHQPRWAASACRALLCARDGLLSGDTLSDVGNWDHFVCTCTAQRK